MDDPDTPIPPAIASLLEQAGIAAGRTSDTARLIALVLQDARDPHPKLTEAALRTWIQDGTWVERTGKRNAHTPARPQEQAGIPPIPDKAPALWEQDAREGETITDFIRQHYRQWMKPDKTGITISDIGRLDPPARTKLRNHMRRHALPDDFHLPTREEKSTALLEQIKAGNPLPTGYKDRSRLLAVAYKRGIKF